MTPEERSNPDLLNPSRKHRIARGAGVDIAEVKPYGKAVQRIKEDDEETSRNDGRQEVAKGADSNFPFNT